MNNTATRTAMGKRVEALFVGLEEDTVSRLDQIVQSMEQLTQLITMQMILDGQEDAKGKAASNGERNQITGALKDLGKAVESIAKTTEQIKAKTRGII